MNLYYKGRCLSSPPVLKLWDTQGYLWLPYDLTEIIKPIGETFEYFFFKYFVIPSGFFHSFRISVIPSEYCHSFRIITISNICHPE